MTPELSQKAVEAVQKYGGHVPNYRARGEQHYRVPFKDKSRLVDVRPHPEWLKVPAHGTRRELLASRRQELMPDISMDVDGDGVVGPTDYFVAKTFGKDNRLTTPERGQVVEALENGFLDKYAWGYDQVGAQRKNVVKQLRGRIYNGDNAHELNHVYPAHFNASKVPSFWTASEMKMHRKAEARNTATKLKEDHEAQNPWHIAEPPLHQENMVDEPCFQSQREKRESQRRETRGCGGLDEETQEQKPRKVPGLSYVESPEAKTRLELLQQRKQRNLEELREAEAQSAYVPPEVRHTRAELEEHEVRRPDPHAMTQNKLLDLRKREYMEYNMRHFPQKHKQLPMFSEQEEHWWKMRQTYVAEPWVRASKERQVTGKVTEAAFEPVRREPEETSAEAQAVQGRLERQPRWTSHFLPKGLMAKVPRHFDRLFEGADGVDEGVKQAPSLSVDTAPLESFSSFRVIREASQSVSHSEGSDKAPKLRSARASTVDRRDSLEGRVNRSGSFRRSVSSASKTRRLSLKANPTLCLAPALLEDLPMTARVRRPEAPRQEPVAVDEPILKVRSGGFQWVDARPSGSAA